MPIASTVAKPFDRCCTRSMLKNKPSSLAVYIIWLIKLVATDAKEREAFGLSWCEKKVSREKVYIEQA